MKKKIAIVFSIFIATPVVLAGVLYITLCIYYTKSFMFGTFINGVYATGKTPEEINEELLKNEHIDTFTIIDKEGKVETIKLENIGYSYSYLESLKEICEKQNSLFWLARIDETVDFDIDPSGSYDANKFERVFNDLQLIKTASDKNNLKVEIKKTQEGYVLIDTTKNLIDQTKCKAVIEEALKSGEHEVNLLDEVCYNEFDYTSQMRETLELYNQIDEVISSEITYKFDTEDRIVGRRIISDFLLVDENEEFQFDEDGKIMLDEEAIKEYVKNMAEDFDTVNRERTFWASRGEFVTVPAGTYGNKLDQKQEIEYLTSAIASGTVEEHEPIYSQRAWGIGENDIGDTYIEVDLTNQKLYYYEGGARILSADVVTGNISRGNGTPARACYVYFMQKNRVLRGEDYATPVDYWMAVYGNIGIHDAKWRGKFGGKIYRSNGSHGCINTPYKEVSSLYSRVKIGTPVMIFY